MQRTREIKQTRGDVYRGRSERFTPADSVGPHAPVKSGAILNAHVTDATTEAQGDETGCSRVCG